MKKALSLSKDGRDFPYLVYSISFPNNKKYIGVNKGLRFYRKYAHLRSARGNSSLPVHCAMRKYGEENITISILQQTKNQKEALKLEQYLIKTLNTIAPNGYNLTAGGEGTINRKMSAEQKEQCRINGIALWKKLKSNPQKLQAYKDKQRKNTKKLWKIASYKNKVIQNSKAIVQSKEYKEKISIERKQRFENPEYYARHKASMKQAHDNDPTLSERKMAKIRMLEKTLEYRQAVDLKKKLFYQDKTNYNNYIKNFYAKCPHMFKGIIDENGNYYRSAKEAARQLKLDTSCIIKVCRGKRKTTGKMKFRYATKEEIQFSEQS